MLKNDKRDIRQIATTKGTCQNDIEAKRRSINEKIGDE